MVNNRIATKCPVCGEHTFNNSHEKCPICGWINDSFQAEHKFVGHGVNYYSLAQQQKAWRILNQEDDEVGYGTDNLLWGVERCNLFNIDICMDECRYHFEKILQGKLPEGVNDLKKAQHTCAHCIMNVHANIDDLKTITKSVDEPYGINTYGNGSWGAGECQYDIEYYKKELGYLIEHNHNEMEKNKLAAEKSIKEPTFPDDTEKLLAVMSGDKTGRNNYTSYFCRSLVSITDFIRYATDEYGVLDHRFDLWAFGELDEDEKYEFTPEEKQDAAKVLHISLSYFNYRCDSMGGRGLFYLDNCYEGWSVEEFADTIAAWFTDIGNELNEENIKWFIKETLEESFAYSHVKLVLYLLNRLGYAKYDKKLQELAKLYCMVPSLADLAKDCLQ